MERQTSSRNSVISLQSSSLFSPENQEVVNELAEKLQTAGIKVAIIAVAKCMAYLAIAIYIILL